MTLALRRIVARYKKYLGFDSMLRRTQSVPQCSLFGNGRIDINSLCIDTFTREAVKKTKKASPPKKLTYIKIGEMFQDSTTKNCDVSVKPKGWNAEFVEFYPESYTTIDSFGQRTTLPALELDYFEMEVKGKGLGSKKIQEIIKFAKEKTGGRMVVSAVQFDKKSPLLFYYRNGLRSTNPEVNELLEQINQGKLSKSLLPENQFMYLPLD